MNSQDIPSEEDNAIVIHSETIEKIYKKKLINEKKIFLKGLQRYQSQQKNKKAAAYSHYNQRLKLSFRILRQTTTELDEDNPSQISSNQHKSANIAKLLKAHSLCLFKQTLMGVKLRNRAKVV